MLNMNDGQRYINGFQSPEVKDKSAFNFVFSDKKILLAKDGEGLRIPGNDEITSISASFSDVVYLGELDGHGCYGMQSEGLTELPENMEAVDVRSVAGITGDLVLFTVAGTALHILNWSRLKRYCGRCGHKTEDKSDERAKICPSCGNTVYTRISPATITLVFKGDEILLAHNKRFANDMYSLIAGFVEPGETLEQCVHREIGEEVGIKVKNVRYFCSQPWPFPDSLMLAFTAEYDSGDVTPDKVEIADAKWFNRETMPQVPNAVSVAGRMLSLYHEGSLTLKNR